MLRISNIKIYKDITDEEVLQNAKTYEEQVFKILDKEKTTSAKPPVLAKGLLSPETNKIFILNYISTFDI